MFSVTADTSVLEQKIAEMKANLETRKAEVANEIAFDWRLEIARQQAVNQSKWQQLTSAHREFKRRNNYSGQILRMRGNTMRQYTSDAVQPGNEMVEIHFPQLLSRKEGKPIPVNAGVHQHGVEKINLPPRPFEFSPMVEDGKKRIKDFLIKAAQDAEFETR